MIGLVDYTLQSTTSSSLAYPNLEIMKLATYYRLEENTFCKLVSLSDTELEGYDKIFFFCESENKPLIPPAFLRAKNVVFGGSSFSEGIYIPFENSVIDFTIPRPSIYKEFLKDKYNEGIKSKVIEHVLDDSYYRMYAGKEKLPIPPIQKRKRLILYDTDFFYDDWEEIIDKISDRVPSTIVRIHPIVCSNLTQFFAVRAKPKIARDTEIILDLKIPLDEVHYMFKQYKNLFLADIVEASNVCLSLGGDFKFNGQYYKDFVYKMNLLYYFWSHKVPLRIRYTPPHLGYSDPLEPLSRRVEVWSHNLNNKKTLDERFTQKEIKEKAPIIKSKELLLKFFPEETDLFKQTYQSLSERRIWRL